MRAWALLAAAAALAACSLKDTREPASFLELRSKGAVLQRHEYSCGAAALATLAGMFGETVDEAGMLKRIFGDALPVVEGPGGRKILRALTLEDLERGARAMNFKVVSVQVPDRAGLDAALRALKPAIARMSLYGEYLHFVVLRESEGDWVSISDPGYGNFRMTKSQFLAAWDAGDRVLLSIGRVPFEAWKVSDEKPIYLRRSAKDVYAAADPPGPEPLYDAVRRRIPEITTLPR